MSLINNFFSPVLFKIYGSLAINSYGLCIAIAAFIGYLLLERDLVIKQLMTLETLSNIAIFIIIAAVLGGRLLWCVENSELFSWNFIQTIKNFFMFWHGGFSITGTISFVALLLPFYLHYIIRVPIVKFLDRLVIYAPLIQAISRIGCFLAGCCHGIESLMPWAISYSNKLCAAPLNIPLHPTQLYSSALLGLLFIGLYTQQSSFKTPGKLVSIYLIGVGAERFLIDFLRADRTLIMNNFSFIQAISCGLILTGILLWYVVSYAYIRQQ